MMASTKVAVEMGKTQTESKEIEENHEGFPRDSL